MSTDRELFLRMEGISKSFPGVQALSNVNFSLYSGEVVGLLGENGAGKSTLMKILSGAYRKDSGKIFIKGKEVEVENPRQMQQLGISIIYQEFNLTRNQSVAENIFLGREPLPKNFGRFLGFVDKKKMEKHSTEILDKLSAKISNSTVVGKLSVAEQQLVEIAKALVVKAQIVIMDEPTAALGDKEVETLFNTINSLKKQGISIIFITHRLEEAFKFTDRIVVLRDGHLICEVKTSDVTPEKVIQMMVGRNLGEFLHKVPGKISAPVLEVKRLRHGKKIKDVSFTLRRGEILGFAGLVGAGRTEIARIIFGIDPKDTGEILIDGRKIEIRSPKDAIREGICLVPEDRAYQGLILKLSILKNIVIATLKLFSKFGWISKNKMYEVADNFVNQLSIRTPNLYQKVMYLSGGNQQKVVLAKWLVSNPKVLILDEPTRGIDVGAKAEVYALMNELVQKGVGIIMISSELPEILGMSDRIVVIHEGKVSAILNRSEATQEIIMAHATGQMKEEI